MKNILKKILNFFKNWLFASITISMLLTFISYIIKKGDPIIVGTITLFMCFILTIIISTIIGILDLKNGK